MNNATPRFGSLHNTFEATFDQNLPHIGTNCACRQMRERRLKRTRSEVVENGPMPKR